MNLNIIWKKLTPGRLGRTNCRQMPKPWRTAAPARDLDFFLDNIVE